MLCVVLWWALGKLAVPEVITLVQSFHEDMKAQLPINGEFHLHACLVMEGMGMGRSVLC